MNQKKQAPAVFLDTVYSSQQIFCIEFIHVFMWLLWEHKLTTSTFSWGTVDACYQSEILN